MCTCSCSCSSSCLSIYLSICKVESGATPRDFLSFWTWEHQKRSNSARRPSKMESWVQSRRPRTNAFCDFSTPPVQTTAPATKKWCQVIRSAAPVTQNHLSKNPHLLLTFNTVHIPLCLPRETTLQSPKVARTCGVFDIDFDFEMCFAPQRRALFRHRNFEECPGAEELSTFWLRNVLRATTACTFSTSHSHFQKWAEPGVFCRFWLRPVLRAARRGVFRQRNFKKYSEPGSFLHFWLWNVLRATTVCNFSSLIWPAGSAPAALASLQFRPSGATNHCKNTVFRDFPTFSRAWIFCLLRLSLFWSSFFFSSLLFSSLLWLFPSLLFICPYCRKFDF